MAEPAVIQNKQINSCLFGTAGKRKQLLFAEIKIGGFPVVDENRTGRKSMGSCDNMVLNKMMEAAAHSIQPGAGIA